MPYQNRVNPYGQLVATAARGTLMGNRGCLHDQADHPRRQYAVRRWIICVFDFKGQQREPMPPGQYTSLFFLDEVTALAAGHRPCAECQRERFVAFCRYWGAANAESTGGLAPGADAIDAMLHAERISTHFYQRDKVKQTYTEQLGDLPDGTMVELDASGSSYLVLGNALVPWSFEGYGQPITRPAMTVKVLTPRSTVRAIAQGYAPGIHMSAFLAR